MANRIIAYTSSVQGGKIALRNSEGDSIASDSVHDLFDFLGEKYSDTERTEPYYEIKVAWDLDAFIAPILRLLGLGACRSIAGPKHEFSYEGGNIFYIPGKVFSLDHGGHRSFIYHLAQYYRDEPEQDDPEEIQAMAGVLVDTLKSMGLNPRKLTSPVAIYDDCVMRHLSIPTIVDLPGSKEEEILDFAEECNGRLWISAYQVGRWEVGEVWSYDLKSAFPWQAAQLYDIRYAGIVKSKTMRDDAHLAFLRGRVTINDNVPVSPIIHRDGNGELKSGVGTYPTTITLDGLNFIKKWGIGDFELDEGWFIRFRAPVKPFNVPLQRLFGLRSQSDLANGLAKRMAAGTYGKLLERHDDGSVGRYYNPIYSAVIVDRTNIQVAEFIYHNKIWNDLVHVGVDGVLSTREVWLDGKTGMGKWGLNGIGPALVISPGRVYTGEKHPQGLNYDEIIALIEAKPKESYYSTKLSRRLTLAEAIELDDLKALGKVKEFSSSLDLNVLRAEQDRIFDKFPRTGRELLENKYRSRPIRMGEKNSGQS